jgi:hypothetical protein
MFRKHFSFAPFARHISRTQFLIQGDTMNKLQHACLIGVAFMVSIGLSACGGGGGDSESPSGTPSTTNALVGTVRGPVGAQVVLQNNGADSTSVTVSSATSSLYNETSFAFPTEPASGAAYSVSLSSALASQTCSVYKGATGTIPVTATSVRVGCEHTYDLLSRSTDDNVLSYGTYNDGVVIGGNATTGEGRYVAFVSYAPNLASGNTSNYYQVFWRDRQTGQTLLVSANSSGFQGNGSSVAPAISADGQKVAFESYATNLAGTDANGTVRDVYIWSASAPTAGVQLVSESTAGVQGNAESFEPTISGDGSVVAFSTYASNLTASVINTGNSNVVRRDLPNNINTLVSDATSGTGVGGNFGSLRPSLSEDGTRLAFWSYASDLVAGDTNGLWDIFVYDSTAGTKTLVSYTNGGGVRDQGSESASRIVTPTISGNGRYVAYSTTATNVVSGDTGGFQDVFVVDTQTQNVVRASVTTAGVPGNADSPIEQGEGVALSYDGAWVAFNTDATNLGTPADNVVMHNISTGETRVVTSQSGSWVSYVALSRGAAYVAFGTGNLFDSRFASSGLFARFTGVGRAWWWID